MTLPTFLVIGAMKAGTTSFYHDLSAHPRIFLAEKEQSGLATATTAEHYAAPFRHAQPGQICGDVSTRYAMLPTEPDIACRARAWLPASTEIFYLVREPVRRAISHHYHMSSHRGAGRMPRDINVALEQHPELIEYGRYMRQLRPWIEQFGAARVHVIVFDDYTQRRHEVMGRVFATLGIDGGQADIRADRAHNRSEGKPILNNFWGTLTALPLYRRWLRPLAPLAVRDRLRSWLLPPAPPPPAPPSPETVERIIAAVEDDVLGLSRFLGRPEPLWDLATVRSHLASQAGATASQRRAA